MLQMRSKVYEQRQSADSIGSAGSRPPVSPGRSNRVNFVTVGPWTRAVQGRVGGVFALRNFRAVRYIEA